MAELNIISISLLTFFFISFVSKKEKTLSEKIMLIWIGTLIIAQVAYLVERAGLIHRYYLIVETTCNINIIHGAALLIYLKSYLVKDYKFTTKELIHLTPLVALIVAKLIMKSWLGLFNCEVEGSCSCSNNIYQQLISWYKIVVVGAYLAASLKLYLKTRKTTSYIKDISAQTKWWITAVAYGSVTLYALVVTFELVQILSIYQITDKLAIINILSSVFAILFLYVGNKYAFILSKVKSDKTKKKLQLYDITSEMPRNEVESGVDTRFEKIFQQIEILMKEEQLFQDPDLTLKVLAEKVNISTTYASQAIKMYTNQTVPSYINSYRLRMVLEKLRSPQFKTYTIISLAYESGFNSKASFNRIFKQELGVTPSEYANSHGIIHTDDEEDD